MNIDLPFVAGIISTTIFALSTLPMLRKAIQTRDLRSYSLGNMVLANGGNAIHSVYVFHLPPGPIWLLHSFYLVTTGLMLFWYLRYEGRAGIRRQDPPLDDAAAWNGGTSERLPFIRGVVSSTGS